jgi:hypothetical protein
VSFYKIRVKGCLDERWSEWFDGLEITNLENGETMLYGDIVDQAARRAEQGARPGIAIDRRHRRRSGPPRRARHPARAEPTLGTGLRCSWWVIVVWVTGHSKRYASLPTKTGRFGQDQYKGLRSHGESCVNDAYRGSDVTLDIDTRGGVGQINLEVV